MLDLLTVGPEFTRPACRAAAAAVDRIYVKKSFQIKTKNVKKRKNVTKIKIVCKRNKKRYLFLMQLGICHYYYYYY